MKNMICIAFYFLACKYILVNDFGQAFFWLAIQISNLFIYHVQLVGGSLIRFESLNFLYYAACIGYFVASCHLMI